MQCILKPSKCVCVAQMEDAVIAGISQPEVLSQLPIWLSLLTRLRHNYGSGSSKCVGTPG